MAYADEDDGIIVVRGNGSGRRRGILRQAGADLMKTGPDDSPLKTFLTYGGAIVGSYFLAELMLGKIKKTQAERTYEQTEERANANPNSAAGLAARLADAFGVRAGASGSVNVDEATIFDIFITKKLVQTREFFGEVSGQYAILSKGRRLLDDLMNNLDPWAQPWKPDWTRLKPYIDKILATSRAKTTPKKITSTPLRGLPVALYSREAGR